MICKIETTYDESLIKMRSLIRRATHLYNELAAYSIESLELECMCMHPASHLDQAKQACDTSKAEHELDWMAAASCSLPYSDLS
jgi:hypothetical protein